MARALVEAVKTTPYIGLARMEAAKVAIRIGFSSKFGRKLLHILLFGTCAAVVISTNLTRGALGKTTPIFWVWPAVTTPIFSKMKT